MASKNLTYNIFGKDRSASRTMQSVGDKAAAVGRRVAAAGAAVAAALAVVVAKFAVESVKAAAQAETQQAKLTAAWAKFPNVVDVNIEALRDYNKVLQKTTKYDDDNIAAAQARLAQFKLTGKQIKALTPLLLDYASKTGKDLESAAVDLGKALLGQGRALKALGVNFKNTGSTAGNFSELMTVLQAKVGGFAEQEGQTAAGKLEILKNRFGELQETIGAALLPVLLDLADTFETDVMPHLEEFADWFAAEGVQGIKDFAGWVDKYKDVLGPAAVAVGGLTAAQLLLNVAMYANPVGAVILAIEYLIAQIIVLTTDLGGIRTWVFQTNTEILKFFVGIQRGIAGVIEGGVNGMIDMLNALIGPINTIRSFFGMGPLGSIGHVNFTAGYDALNSMASSFINGGPSAQAGAAGRGSGARNVHAFAEGGIVRARPGGIMAQIGEAGHDEAVIPLTSGVLGQMGGTTVVLNVGTLIADDNRAVQKLQRMVGRATRRGAVPVGALTGA